jgi:hypothetical protein
MASPASQGPPDGMTTMAAEILSGMKLATS